MNMTGWIADFMNHPATYLKSGWFQISVSNLLVILLMLAIFAIAILLPFPREKKEERGSTKETRK
jgi:hypothetical protein